jgi:alkanesulfonate monooxygenase SsuD/methylene tetrahydromethanopterin reductase-like flavin-dependent oxidoreductase (luciferase family)
MLRLTGRAGDAWLPSVGGHYLQPEDVAGRQRLVDEGARSAGRDPAEVRRAVNVMELTGEPEGWAGQLARIAELGFDTLLVAVPGERPLEFIRRLGEDVAPEVRARAGGG